MLDMVVGSWMENVAVNGADKGPVCVELTQFSVEGALSEDAVSRLIFAVAVLVPNCPQLEPLIEQDASDSFGPVAPAKGWKMGMALLIFVLLNLPVLGPPTAVEVIPSNAILLLNYCRVMGGIGSRLGGF